MDKGLFSGSHPSLSKPHHSVFFPDHLPWFPALARAIPPTLNKTHPAAPKHPHLLPKPVQFKTPFLHYPVGGGAALSETTGSSHSNYTPSGTLTRTIHPKLSPFLNPTSCSTQDVFPLDQVQIPECATHTPSTGWSQSKTQPLWSPLAGSHKPPPLLKTCPGPLSKPYPRMF